MDIAENVRYVRQRIEAASLSAGRRPEEIMLVAATKMNSADRVREAIAAGVDACGENRVQEMLGKLDENAYDGVPLHFIGHLQKNKVRQTVGRVKLIESVDSPELMRMISALAQTLGIKQEILLEINIAGEAAKTGAPYSMLPEMLELAGGLDGILVRGLMAIPPVSTKKGENRPYFNRMRQLFVDNMKKKYNNVCMDILSMGMSGDYEDAIAEGANMVRVGTAIFGKRNYSPEVR